MFVIVGGRRSGKTETAIRWLMEDPEHRVLVVPNEAERRRILRELLVLVPQIDPEYFKGRIFRAEPGIVAGYGFRGMNVREIGIDGLEQVLQALLGLERISLITTDGTTVAPMREPLKDILAEQIAKVRYEPPMPKGPMDFLKE